MQDISRRGFLTGAGAAAGLAAAAGMGLTGCAPASSGSKAASSDAALTASAASKQKWSFETAPSMPADSEIKQTYQADVVVVGSGVSGMCCAVSAAESGCDTIVVSASRGARADQLTAITFLANAEALVQLAVAAGGGASNGPAPSLAGLASSISSIGP